MVVRSADASCCCCAALWPLQSRRKPDATPKTVHVAGSYQIDVDNSYGQGLGLELDGSSGKALLITSIMGGLVQEWNAEHQDICGVCVGDSIHAVGSVSVDAEKLLRALHERCALSITLIRRLPASSDSPLEKAALPSTTTCVSLREVESGTVCRGPAPARISFSKVPVEEPLGDAPVTSTLESSLAVFLSQAAESSQTGDEVEANKIGSMAEDVSVSEDELQAPLDKEVNDLKERLDMGMADVLKNLQDDLPKYLKVDHAVSHEHVPAGVDVRLLEFKGLATSGAIQADFMSRTSDSSDGTRFGSQSFGVERVCEEASPCRLDFDDLAAAVAATAVDELGEGTRNIPRARKLGALQSSINRMSLPVAEEGQRTEVRVDVSCRTRHHLQEARWDIPEDREPVEDPEQIRDIPEFLGVVTTRPRFDPDFQLGNPRSHQNQGQIWSDQLRLQSEQQPPISAFPGSRSWRPLDTGAIELPASSKAAGVRVPPCFLSCSRLSCNPCMGSRETVNISPQNSRLFDSERSV